jgi:hypothetical protein
MAQWPFVGPWSLFQFLDPIESRQDSLDGGSSRRTSILYTSEIRKVIKFVSLTVGNLKVWYTKVANHIRAMCLQTHTMGLHRLLQG